MYQMSCILILNAGEHSSQNFLDFRLFEQCRMVHMYVFHLSDACKISMRHDSRGDWFGMMSAKDNQLCCTSLSLLSVHYHYQFIDFRPTKLTPQQCSKPFSSPLLLPPQWLSALLSWLALHWPRCQCLLRASLDKQLLSDSSILWAWVLARPTAKSRYVAAVAAIWVLMIA